MSKRTQCTFVNEIDEDKHGKRTLLTYTKGHRHAGFYECPFGYIVNGVAENEDWLTMDANLKACTEYYQEKDRSDIKNWNGVEVTISFVHHEDRTVTDVEVIEVEEMKSNG